MYVEDSAAFSGSFTPRAVLSALICAIISIVLIRSGFLSFLFLVPLGYGAAVYNPATAWLAFVSAAIINGMLSIGIGFYSKTGSGGLGMDVLHYTVMALGFTWIMAGGSGKFRIRTMYRFIAAGLCGTLTFLFIAYTSRNSEGFTVLIQSQAEWISSVYISASGADAAQRSFLEQNLTPEKVMEVIIAAALRGGALISAFFIFFINRQVSLSLARIFRRRRSGSNLSAFHVPANTIWVLSLSLALILLSRIVKMTIPEIAAWNVLVLCGLLFLAQGGGIALYTLTQRPMPPAMRMVCNVLLVVVILTPGINTLALGGLILLGIAENWLPLRAVKQDGSASTPGL